MDQRPTLSAERKALLEQRLRGAGARPRERAIPARPQQGSAPLSFAQNQVWVIDQMTPGNPAYNLVAGYRLGGALDVQALEDGFNEIVRRHEALRTTFAVKGGEPSQVIHPALTVRLEITPQVAGEEQLHALALEESLKPFDLARLPLIRLRLVKLADAEHVLVVCLHHIVADGLSMGVMLEELDAFYRARSGGASSPPRALPLQYGDYAQWQRSSITEQSFAQQAEFWRRRLGGRLPVLELPTDKPRPPSQSFSGSNVFFRIPKTLAAELNALGAREGCTFFMTVLAAFQVLLHRYSEAEEVVIGTPIANRTPAELGALIGNFLNMAALRCDVSGNPTFTELLRRSRDTTLDAFSNTDLPFEAMLNSLKFERDPSRNPIFQVMLQVMSPSAPRIGELQVRSFHFDLGIAQFDLSLHLYEEDGGYLGRFEYCKDLFRADTVARLASNFQQLLQAVAANPAHRIQQIPILTEAESAQVTRQWNDTRIEYPTEARLHDAFETQAAREPGRTALRFGTATLTYGELEARANRLAQTLRARGIGRGQRVGICLERGPDLLASVLGALKAGAAYVPLDPSFPQERLRFMAQDGGLSVLVSSTALASAFDLPRAQQLLLDADAAIIAGAPDRRVDDDARARPMDPAYVIYTSGSTGKPKGVVVPHGAVVNFLASMAREPGLRREDILLAVTTLSFDIAVLELQLPLAVGATIIMASREDTIDGAALKALLERHQVTVMQATPTTWRLLLEAGWRGGKSFKALVGGEALPKELADRLIGAGAELWNMYGPTETTVWSTCARLTDTTDGISIGKPIANTVVRILDAQRNLCPIGVPGELYIGGDGLSLGYWNRAELTAERFVADPFGADGAKLYRTGDRARWRNDGGLEHLGRLDFQVKVRGYRIELGEIEAVIARQPAIREAVVVVREDTPGDKRLVAYLVADGAPADLAEQLRALVRAHLPEYMVPAHFVALAALPLTPNAKIDRKALPAPQAADGALGASAYVAPRNDLEISLATAWQKVLGVERVGITDNFFELGGNSLSVLKLIFEMEQASGVHISLGDVFRSPTIAALVNHLAPDAIREASVVVPLQREGSEVPLFCICGIEIYSEFARSLGKQQPVYGVYVEEEQAIISDVLQGSKPGISIGRLVEAYEKAIARFRPSGPYRLAGLSFGGVLAMELASRLRSRGEEVSLVFLLDTMLPEGRRRNWLKWFARQVHEMLAGAGAAKLHRLYKRLRKAVPVAPAAQSKPSVAVQSNAAFARDRGAAFFQASRHWKPHDLANDFPVVLFRASDRGAWTSDVEFDRDYGWRRYLGERLRTLDVEGDHIGMMTPPNVADLGRRARQYLG